MKVCKHEKLAFLGYQETLEDNEYLTLYSCMSCHTTISFKKSNKFKKVKELKISNNQHVF